MTSEENSSEKSQESMLDDYNDLSTIDPNDTRVILSVDSQVLSKIQQCNQRAAYRHIDNIEKEDVENTALEKGLVVHEGMAEFYLFKHKVEFETLRSQTVSRMESFAAAKTSLSNADINECIDAMNGYMKEKQFDSWKVLFHNDEPLVEKTFAKLLYQNEEVIILYTGVTDLVVEFGNLHPPVDHKTYSSYYKAAVMSNQFHGYCWARNAPNLIVNRIGLGKKIGQNERVIVSYTPEELEEWKNNATFDILNHYSQMKAGWFRKNYEACEEYGGCTFKMLCNAKPSARPILIKVNYKQVPVWSPFDRN